MDPIHFTSDSMKVYSESNKLQEMTLIIIVISLLILYMVVQLAAKRYFVKVKFRSITKPEGKKNRWDKIPRYPIWKAIWLCKDQKSIIQSARRLSAEYGPLLRVTGFGQEYVVLHTPELAEKILSSRDLRHTVKPPQLYGPIIDMIGEGVFASNGELWHSRRKTLSKAFTNPALKRYIQIYNKSAKRLVAQLTNVFRKDDKEYHQINFAIQASGFEIIAETVLGLDVTQYKKDTEIMFTSVNRWRQIAFERLSSGWFVLPQFLRWSSVSGEYNRTITNIEDVIKRMIKRYRDERQESKLGSNNTESFDNMMELMIKSGLNESEILNEVKTMIMAGYETVSATIHILLFMLASNQTHQILCREEVDRIFGDPAKCVNAELTMDALSEMKYVERCLLESMRMFPISYMTARKLETPLLLDDDLEVPSGTTVVLPTIILHRSPNLFPQPDEFQPDRFLPENCAKRRAYTYLPFSAGPRICIGLKFAILEAKTIVAHILREFEIYTCDKIDDVPIIPSVLLRPERDFYFRLEKRNVKPSI
ncbi:unnamed protein product [Orchesella dallaii]|uniref:Cytochrome P450 n=1 Tax=Orchesella dallaii TaxID=48710 RepID=A0ABP1S9Q7_9HEXA